MKKEKTFNIGDEVSWVSQAGGHATRKTGRVIEVVPADCFPATQCDGATRSHESYIVSVTKRQGTKKKISSRVTYWPVASRLAAVKPRTTHDAAAKRSRAKHATSVAVVDTESAQWKDTIPTITLTPISSNEVAVGPVPTQLEVEEGNVPGEQVSDEDQGDLDEIPPGSEDVEITDHVELRFP